MSARFLPPDLHVHTNASWCAGREMSPDAIARAGEISRIPAIGLADHLWLDPKRGTRPAPERLLRLREEIRKPDARKILLVGAEADCAPGIGAAGGKSLSKLDFAVVAYHFADLRRGLVPWPETPEALASMIVDGFRAVIEAPFVTVAGHPFFIPPRILARLPEGLLSNLDEAFEAARKRVGPLFELAARRGIALELNAKALGPVARRTLLPLFRAAAEQGCRFALSSDSHMLGDIGKTRLMLGYAEKIGLKESSFLEPGA